MSTFGFDTEEKVLSYHGPLLYEASVIDRTVRQAPDGVTKIKLYLLHYSGWNSHWDEWVPESRLLKHNPQNLRVQKERVKEFQRARFLCARWNSLTRSFCTRRFCGLCLSLSLIHI